MAKFHETEITEGAISSGAPKSGKPEAEVHDRSIGDIIRDTRHLNADQIEKILAYQRNANVRFGEAAVALGFASVDDVLHALARQFNYPYGTTERKNVSPELVTLNEPFSAQAEAFRAIRSQVTMRLFGENKGRRALAIISPEAGDGKTFFSANLAVALAQLGGRTLLVDADLRGPRQHEVFNLGNSAGLSGILSGRAETRSIQQVEGINTLFVLPSGPTPPNPLELIERPTFGFLMRELTLKFEHVIVDTAAAQYGSDAAVAASRCGAALVVARNGRGKVSALQELVGMLSGSPAEVIGTVMNDY